MIESGTIPVLQARGAHIPRLGLGTYDLNGSACSRIVEAALAMGYRHIDTAEMYDNEDAVGIGMRASSVPRSDIFLTTKIWYTDLHAGKVHACADRSLHRLRTDYVDLLLIHWPNPTIPLAETLGAMIELQTAGKVRFIGVSNFSLKLLDDVERLFPRTIVCNQVECHFLLGQDRLRTYARDHGMALTAYSPLAKGEAAKNNTLKKIGAKHGKTGSQIALRWLMDQENVVAIPKSSSVDRLRENMSIFDFTLSEADQHAVASLPKDRRHVTVPWALDWD